MTNELTVAPLTYTRDQVDLIKRTVANGSTDDELKLFIHTAKKTGLDPLTRQIHAIKRGGRMTIQTGIDGLRLIADRTGKYAPGPITVETEGDKIISATATVRKLVADTWHDVTATAYFDEYKQEFNGRLGGLWAKMPRVMISKCAEAICLRRAFPAELSGLYSTEEMSQADSPKEPEVYKNPEPAFMPKTAKAIEEAELAEDEPIPFEPTVKAKQKQVAGNIKKVIEHLGGKEVVPAKDNGTVITGQVEAGEIAKKGTNKNGKPYTKYSITVGGEKHSTFSSEYFNTAREAKQNGWIVSIEYKTTRWGRDIVDMEVSGDANIVEAEVVEEEGGELPLDE